MFTDVEGSTALRTSLGDGEADKLFHQHDEIISAEIEANRGQDLQAALGDGFLAVFVSTRRAIACAVGIQQNIERFNRGRAAAPLKVRIGLNTGEVAWQNGQPSGEAIHAASRVCGAADGGEVFVSDVTRQLAGTVPDVTFSDRGEHTLKGFPQPWKLWSLAWLGLAPETPEAVFVGREQEVETLRKHLLSALDGKGGLVLIGGEPGVGKTTLTKQLIKEAEARGAVALFGRCYESEGAVPYSPFVEFIEQSLRTVPAEWLREDMGEDAPEMARMVPELRRYFPDIPEPLDLPPEQQRRYFFNAVSSFIERASSRLPTVLVLDDVHWADEPTLLLIEHVAEQLKELRVLGVGTYRDVELDVSRPLAGSLERLLRARVASRISVQRFDQAGVSQMLGALAGGDPPPKLVDAIFSETEGNPFFVEEIFRHFVEEGKVFDEDGAFRSDIEVDELDVPESVRLVVGRRLERLGAEAKRALAAGAVVGRGFSFRLLETISDIVPDALLDIIDEAEAAKVIVPEEREGDVHYTFAHELIRQTLLSSLSIPRRQRLHLAVADAIERLDPTASETKPSEIATHLLESGVAADADRTIKALTRAADRAYDAAAFEDVVRLVQSTLDMLPADDALRRTQMLEKLGRAQRAIGHYEESLATMRTAITTYRDLGEAEAAGRVTFDAGYVLTVLGRFDEAAAINQEGIDLLGDRNVPERANLLAGVGVIVTFAGFLDMGEEYFQKAEEVVEALGPAVKGRVEWLRSVNRQVVLDIPGAIASGRRAVDLLRESGDVWTLADALGWLSTAKVFNGDNDEAIQLGREGAELAHKIGHISAIMMAQRGVDIGLVNNSGDLEAYEAAANADLALAESIASPFAAQSYTWLGVVAQLRGRVDEALTHHDKACEIETPSAFAAAWGFRVLNRAFAGDREACGTALAERTEELTNPETPQTAGHASDVLNAAETAAILGLQAEAAKLYPAIYLPDSWAGGRFYDGAIPARIVGMAAAAAGEWDEAEKHFELVLSQLERQRHALEDPQIRHWFGKMLLDRGQAEDRDRARELIGAALEDYNRIGMPLHAGWAEELLK